MGGLASLSFQVKAHRPMSPYGYSPRNNRPAPNPQRARQAERTGGPGKMRRDMQATDVVKGRQIDIMA